MGFLQILATSFDLCPVAAASYGFNDPFYVKAFKFDDFFWKNQAAHSY